MEKTSSFEDMLFNKDVLKSTRSIDVLLKQYELYVEQMDKVYDRRSNVNTFYLSLNSILLTGLAVLLSQEILANTSYLWFPIAAFVGIAGIAFCIAWQQAILSARAFIVAKYKIIRLLETKLPARPYDIEWEMLKQGTYKYTPFSNIEKTVPLIFIGAYSVIIVSLVLIFIF